MKQSTVITKVVMFVLFIGVILYMAVAAWQSFDQPFSTILTYQHTVDDSAEATGFLVRSERVIPGQSSIVDTLPKEGEKVSAGETVAMLYRDEAALARKKELRALELQLEQLNYALLKGDGGWDNQRLDENIVDAIVTLRAASSGDLSGLEDAALSFKSLILTRESTYSDNAEGIADQRRQTQEAILALKNAALGDTTPVSVDQSGVFSALADGYETVLTPAALDGLTPSGLDRLAAEMPTAPVGSIGKLITSSTWYFTAALPEVDAARLVEGRQVKVRFSRDWSGDVAMKVARIGAPENGRVAVVFSTNRFLSNITLLRRQTVDIVFSSTIGIRVPKLAVRSQTQSMEDAETGAITESKQMGVYVLTGAQAEFKPVNILVDDGDHYLVEAALSDNPSENQMKAALRAGDEVIVASAELYDGKVVL